jgi:hypothetical protein
MLDLLGRKSAIVTVLEVMSREQLSQSVAWQLFTVERCDADLGHILAYNADNYL